MYQVYTGTLPLFATLHWSNRASQFFSLAFVIYYWVARGQVIAFYKFLIFMYIRRIVMTRPDKDEKREERIHMETVVDAYGPEEQAIEHWHNWVNRGYEF